MTLSTSPTTSQPDPHDWGATDPDLENSIDSAWNPFATPPATVGGDRFVLSRLIGSGGSGEVYLATDRARGDTCAVKLCERKLMDKTRASSRFIAEARALGRLRSRYIVKIRTGGREGAFYWYAMEFLENGSLRDVLQKTPRMSCSATLRLAFEILLALDEVHRHGMVHRDVKPGNVLIGSDGQAVLADFGIARHPDGTVRFRTVTGSFVGTRDYAAPEVACGSRRADERADLFSVAAVIFHCLTGDRPGQLVRMALSIDSLDHLPPPVRPLLRTAGARRRDARYASARDMAHDVAVTASILANDAGLVARWMAELRPEPSAFARLKQQLGDTWSRLAGRARPGAPRGPR